MHPLSPLPLKHGVAPSYVWLPAGAWPDMLSFLLARFPHVSAEIWQARMARGEVRDERNTVLHAHSPFRRGACVFYYRELSGETPAPEQEHILFRDAHLLVVDKPHFMAVTPSGRLLHETLLVRLKRQLQLAELQPIHRLDRETAGVIVFALNRASRGAYQSLFESRSVHKEYEALAAPLPPAPFPPASFSPASFPQQQHAQSPSRERQFPLRHISRLEPGEPFFRMQEVAGDANSETLIDVITRGTRLWHYRLTPVTGRKHQLRVHMAALGAPIHNDTFYPTALPCKGDDLSAPLQLLARQIRFTDPLTGEQRCFTSLRQLALNSIDGDGLAGGKDDGGGSNG